jgi:hypothetical protein
MLFPDSSFAHTLSVVTFLSSRVGYFRSTASHSFQRHTSLQATDGSGGASGKATYPCLSVRPDH